MKDNGALKRLSFFSLIICTLRFQRETIGYTIHHSPVYAPARNTPQSLYIHPYPMIHSLLPHA